MTTRGFVAPGLLVLGLTLAGQAAQAQPKVGDGLSGTWITPDGTLISLSEVGTRVTGQVVAPTAPMIAGWGWASGDALLEATRDGSQIEGFGHIRFPVAHRKQCPLVGDVTSAIELQVVAAGKMMGRFKARILRKDCSIVEGPWMPAEFTRQLFVVRETPHEIGISLQEGILFDLDRAELKPSSRATLERMKALVIDRQEYVGLAIEGHTDDRGATAYNGDLSRRRAEAVAAWLVSSGVEAGSLTAKGFGKSRPAVPNTSDANRAKNRRVEITLQK